MMGIRIMLTGAVIVACAMVVTKAMDENDGDLFGEWVALVGVGGMVTAVIGLLMVIWGF
jgi:hypothetical protein